MTFPTWKVTDLGPGKLGIECPRKTCGGKAVVSKKWRKGGFVTRPCTYCFKAASIPGREK